jgi:hypothetical protein
MRHRQNRATLHVTFSQPASLLPGSSAMIDALLPITYRRPAYEPSLRSVPRRRIPRLHNPFRLIQ